MTGKRPTEAQRLFAKYIVVDEMGKSEAFRKAFPEHASHLMTAQKIAVAANKKFRSDGVQRAIKGAERQDP